MREISLETKLTNKNLKSSKLATKNKKALNIGV